MKKSIWEKTIRVSGSYGEYTGKVIVTINYNSQYHMIEAFVNDCILLSHLTISEDSVIEKSVSYIQEVTERLHKLANTPPSQTFIDKMNDIFND